MLQFTTEEKEKISQLLMAMYNQSSFTGSKEKFAKSIGLVTSDITNIDLQNWKEKSHLIGDKKWITIARIVNYQKNKNLIWKTAETEIYKYITKQLKGTQSHSITGILVDEAGIGKTHTCKEYCKKNKNAFYIDCSISPKKIAFIRHLGNAVGCGGDGKVEEVLEDIIYTLRNMEKPILVLDEAGDLEHNSILILKRLYNALEDTCGFYLIGADGLKAKIQRGIQYKKLGFVEVFSRFGKKFSTKVGNMLMQEKAEFFKEMAEEIAKENGITNKENMQKIKSKLFQDGVGDMRNVKRMIIGMKDK